MPERAAVDCLEVSLWHCESCALLFKIGVFKIRGEGNHITNETYGQSPVLLKSIQAGNKTSIQKLSLGKEKYFLDIWK